MRWYCTLENEMYRYFYGTYITGHVPFEERGEAELTCAGNDRAAVQLLLYGEEESMLTLDRTPAFYKAYPVEALRVEIDFPSLEDGGADLSFVGLVRDDDGTYKSEVLLGAKHLYQEKKKIAQVYMEVRTGRNTPPGRYTGKIRLYRCGLLEDEVLERELEIRLTVLPFVLKELWEGEFYLNLWQHHTSLARTYETELWGEEHFALLEHYVIILEELGQRAITVVASDAPWAGQWSSWNRTNPSDCFEYNMVRVTRSREGAWSYDFSVMNRYIRLCMEHHIDREIEVFGLLGVWIMEDAGFSKVLEDGQDAVRVRYLDETDHTCRYIRRKEDLRRYVKAIDENFCENGWQDKVRIVCDEPNDKEVFKELLAELKPLIPHLKFKAAICSFEVMREDYAEIRDYVMNLPLVLEDGERIAEIREKRDITLSCYTATVPDHPNTFLCCHPAESRFIPWLSRYLGMDGFLRWAIWLWPDQPFDYDAYHYQKYKAGGTHFVYPGKNGKPLYSLRLKYLKKGIRDCLVFEEYIRRTGDRQGVLKAIEGVMKVSSPEQMGGNYRRKPGEIISLSCEDYDETVNALLRKLGSL